MRFAGQRFRSPRQGMPKQRAQSGSSPAFRAEYGVPGLEPAMQRMPDKNAASMAFTRMPDMSNPPFNAGNYSEPEFRSPSRIQ